MELICRYAFSKQELSVYSAASWLLGAFIPVVSVPMAGVLLAAMFTVHLQYGFSAIKIQAITATGPQFGPPGYEADLLYLTCLAALVFIGSGPFSIGSFLSKRANASSGE